TTTTFPGDQSVTFTAPYNGTSATATINLVTAVTVSSLACNPTSLGANASSTCTVTLSKAAPTGGASVTLTDTSSALTVPASVTMTGRASSRARMSTTDTTP